MHDYESMASTADSVAYWEHEGFPESLPTSSEYPPPYPRFGGWKNETKGYMQPHEAPSLDEVQLACSMFKPQPAEFSKDSQLRNPPSSRFQKTTDLEIGPNITTLMICSLSCRQNLDEITEAINAHGFGDTYNLLYMPLHHRTAKDSQRRNLGYAFINFKKAEDAAKFARTFNNSTPWKSATSKTCSIRPAHHQGFKESMHRYLHLGKRGYLVISADAPTFSLDKHGRFAEAPLPIESLSSRNFTDVVYSL